jgi:hypothetical protein
MADTQILTVRIPTEHAKDLDAVSRIDGVSTAESVRQAIVAHVESRRNDPEFQGHLRAIIEQDREILERLGQ